MNEEEKKEFVKKTNDAFKKSYEPILKEVKEQYSGFNYSELDLDTIAIYRQHTKQIECSGNENYDFTKLERHITVFSNLPKDKKVDSISSFVVYVSLYINKPLHIKHYKEDKKKIKKETHYLNETKRILQNYTPSNNFDHMVYDGSQLTYDNILEALQTAEKLIATLNKANNHLLRLKNKSLLKKFLYEINNEYNLQKSLEMKQLLDEI